VDYEPIAIGQSPWARDDTHDPGLQRLAIGILERALLDLGGLLRGPRPRDDGGDVAPRTEDADDALALLTDADTLEPYCDLACTTPCAVQREARRRMRTITCRAFARLLANRM
jgi:hypothetical protein